MQIALWILRNYVRLVQSTHCKRGAADVPGVLMADITLKPVKFQNAVKKRI